MVTAAYTVWRKGKMELEVRTGDLFKIMDGGLKRSAAFLGYAAKLMAGPPPRR